MEHPLIIISNKYLTPYKSGLNFDLQNALAAYNKLTKQDEDFNFYIANAAVYSSNIEGNTISFDTYLKSNEFNLHLKTKELKEIEDLIIAYKFAQINKLTLANILTAHELITNNILKKKERGKIRKVQVGVRSEGKLIYLAIEPEYILSELNKLIDDINILITAPLTIEEIFYYAAYIHLTFVNIHPFVDGNGRASRLIEKWFISQCTLIGNDAWFITSEKNYWNNRLAYYKNLQLGVNYYEVKYEKCVPFLLMLPNSLL